MSRIKKYFWVYFLYVGDEVVYIGMTGNLKERFKNHRIKDYTSVRIQLKTSSKIEALSEERKNTILYTPKCAFIPEHLQGNKNLGLLRYEKQAA